MRSTPKGRRKPGRRADEIAIRLHIETLKEGGYLATSPDVPGLVAEGRSITEAVEIVQGLTRKIIESCLEHGDPSRKRKRLINARIRKEPRPRMSEVRI